MLTSKTKLNEENLISHLLLILSLIRCHPRELGAVSRGRDDVNRAARSARNIICADFAARLTSSRPD